MKKLILTFLSMVLILGLAHCQSVPVSSQDPDFDEDLLPPVEEKGLLRLEVQHHDRDGQAIPMIKEISQAKELWVPDLPLKAKDPWQGPPGYYRKEFETDLGYQIHLEIGEINWHRVKLIADDKTPSCPQAMEHEFFIDRAENLMAPDLTLSAVTSAMATRGAYCDYEITVAPAGATPATKQHGNHGGIEDPGKDTLKPGAPWSLKLEGTWFKENNSGLVRIQSVQLLRLRGAIQSKIAGKLLPAPLLLVEEESFCWATRYDLLLEGIDFEGLSEDEIEERVLENLVSSVVSCF